MRKSSLYELMSYHHRKMNLTILFSNMKTLKKGLEVEIKCYSSSGLTDISSIEYIIYINSYLLYKITIKLLYTSQT